MVGMFGKLTDRQGLFLLILDGCRICSEREGGFVLAICFISKAYSFQPDFYGVNHPQVFYLFFFWSRFPVLFML